MRRVHNVPDVRWGGLRPVAPSPEFLSDTLLYGINVAVPASAIEYGSASITVTSGTMDVSRDGLITLVDPLQILNRLAERHESPDVEIDIPRYDVNQDLQMTANDAIIVINFVDARNKETTAAAPAEPQDDEEEVVHASSLQVPSLF